ncbi:hypothetical protein Vretimale_5780, partial [Volvox reticuliferus]
GSEASGGKPAAGAAAAGVFCTGATFASCSTCRGSSSWLPAAPSSSGPSPICSSPSPLSAVRLRLRRAGPLATGTPWRSSHSPRGSRSGNTRMERYHFAILLPPTFFSEI